MQTKLLIPFAAATLLAGCMTPKLPRVRDVPVRAEPNPKLRLRSVEIYDGGSTTVVRVDLLQGRGVPGRPGGRIIVEALKDGRVVAGKNINWYFLRRGPFRGASYRTSLPVAVSTIDEIKISRAPRKSPACSEGRC